MCHFSVRSYATYVIMRIYVLQSTALRYTQYMVCTQCMVNKYVLWLNIQEVDECKGSEIKMIFVNYLLKLISQQVHTSHVYI